MQEMVEITELCPDDGEEIQTDQTLNEDDIEAGLEILAKTVLLPKVTISNLRNYKHLQVALEMGHILEQLKDNLEKLSCTQNTSIEKDSTEGESQSKSNQEHKPKQTVPVANARADKLHKPRGRSNSHKSILPGKLLNKPDKNIKSKNSVSSNSTDKSSEIFKNKPKCMGQVINSKPNYQVQKINCRNAFNKVAGEDNSLCPILPKTENRICNYIDNKISPVQAHCSKVFETNLPSQRSAAPSTLRKLPDSVARQSKRHLSLSAKSSKILETLKPLQDEVERAIRERKTFTVCGNYYTVRRALLSRGWVEKIRITYNTYDKENLKKMQSSSILQLLQGLNDGQNAYVYKRVIMSKLLGQHQVDFYWDQNYDCFRTCRDVIKMTLVNRFKRGIFSYTSKHGLCESMKRSHWFQQPGVALVRHPRSYNLSNSEDPKEFINDFKLTAAMSLLKWVVKQQDNYRGDKITSETGKIPIQVFQFAVAELLKTIRKCKHEDIDYTIEDALDFEWNQFLECYYKIVHIGSCFKTDQKLNCYKLLETAKDTLAKIEKFWPHLRMDGQMNIWILKPTNGSRGEGIYLCRTLQYILKTIKSNTSRRYIVQKYIERPLLIHNTKFDIRQWFLISSSVPLTIWIYKDCYVRFSSQLYSLQKLHESIHLTNNSIQCRYKNCPRNAALPRCNMWDAHQFQRYLKSVGYPTVFTDIIYPGMKQSITGAILMNQNNLDNRRNCFELYGSDFMLTEDFQPWLIEINSRPALYASTPVTARLCPQVLDDLIKVVIDHPKNPKAFTGRFELLYKEDVHNLPIVKPEDFKLKGQQLPTSYFHTPGSSADEHIDESVSTQLCGDSTQYNIKKISSEMKTTLEHLLNLIQVERERRQQLKHQSSQVTNAVDLYTNTDLQCHKTQTPKYPELIIEDLLDEENRYSRQSTSTDAEVSTQTAVLLEVIKSVASNLKTDQSAASGILTSEQLTATQSLKAESLHDLQNQNRKDLTKVKAIKSDNPKGIFRDIIDSIRSLPFVYKQR